MNCILNFKKRDAHPFETDTKARHSSSLTFLLTGQLAEGGMPNLLIHERYLRYMYLIHGRYLRYMYLIHGRYLRYMYLIHGRYLRYMYLIHGRYLRYIDLIHGRYLRYIDLIWKVPQIH